MRKRPRRRKRGRLHLLARKEDRFSLTAFWFSMTMAVCLLLAAAVTLRFIIAPAPEFVSGLPGIAAVLSLPNAILAGAYTWGKKIDKQA